MIRRVVRFLDQRSGTAPFVKKALRYLFPDHWSFLLGEVALYCFIDRKSTRLNSSHRT